MNQTDPQDLASRVIALECEGSRLIMWAGRIYSHSHLGVRKPSLSDNNVLSGADPITTDPMLLQHVQRKDVIGAAKRFQDLTGVGLMEAKAALKKQIR